MDLGGGSGGDSGNGRARGRGGRGGVGGVWAARAAAAERGVATRNLRGVWLLPGTLLGVSGSPATLAERLHGPWNYWWQAHLLDCLVDAYVRAPTAPRRARVGKLITGIRVRNAPGWRNDYYDDMAWLALALERAERHVTGSAAGRARGRIVGRTGAVADLSEALYRGWTEDGGGGIWWRKRHKYREDFKNVPANGPAAILFARLREPRAYATAHWIESHLVDTGGSGLVWDGLHVSRSGSIREIETTRYTYNQGTFLGACVELARWDRDGAEAEFWLERAVRTIDAVATHLTVRGNVLRGQGGGDGGLFGGILARYLAEAALALPEFGSGYEPAARTAADLVFGSAQAVWDNAAWWRGPVFGHDWSVPARLPRAGGVAERDLSVQTGAWMLLEAAARLARAAIGAAGPGIAVGGSVNANAGNAIARAHDRAAPRPAHTGPGSPRLNSRKYRYPATESTQ